MGLFKSKAVLREVQRLEERKKEREREAALKKWRATGRRQSTPGIVYFAQTADGGPIKIGFTTNLASRQATLQTGLALQLTIIGELEATMEDEWSLHQKFSDLKIQGEWFHAAEPLIGYLRQYGFEPIAPAGCVSCPKLASDLAATKERLREAHRQNIALWEAIEQIQDLSRKRQRRQSVENEQRLHDRIENPLDTPEREAYLPPNAMPVQPKINGPSEETQVTA